MSYGYTLILLDSSRLSMLSIIHAHFEIPTQSSLSLTHTLSLSLFPPFLTVYKNIVISKNAIKEIQNFI